jgi:hypothetical protein
MKKLKPVLKILFPIWNTDLGTRDIIKNTDGFIPSTIKENIL